MRMLSYNYICTVMFVHGADLQSWSLRINHEALRGLQTMIMYRAVLRVGCCVTNAMLEELQCRYCITTSLSSINASKTPIRYLYPWRIASG